MQPYNRFFSQIIRIIGITFLLTGCSYGLLAQKKGSDSDFLPDVLIAKVKTSSIHYFTDEASLRGFNTLIAPVTLQKAEKLFPNSAAPLTEDGVDLSRIYILTFSGVDKSALGAFAEQLQSYGAFEYVELKYIQQQHALAFIPNDTLTNSIDHYQKYLTRMQAYEAWAIEKGSPDMVIGIVDTGVDYLHEDMISNIAYNTDDPVNNIDDDGDGYIDNYYGWDLANNDNNPIPPYNDLYHGATVASVASASTNNNIGMAGIGFNSRILPVKASPDSYSAVTKGYEGIVYAAEHGCKVINLSWGGTGSYSSYCQDVINYATLNKDVLIVAAAGNSDEEADYYPAAYDNVLSVIAMDTIFSPSAGKYIDTRAQFLRWAGQYKATYAHSVDIGAQGFGILGIKSSNRYSNIEDGSSLASPIIAGSAAIVRSHFPMLNAIQAAELLRVTADVVDTFPENAVYKEKMGKGRVNLYKALTVKSPAVRMTSNTAASRYSTALFSGDTIFLTGKFWNYLSPTANLTIDLSTTSPDIKVLNNTFQAGVIDSMKGKENLSAPFTFLILPSASSNQIVEFRIGYTDPATGYGDYQFFTLALNPLYINISTDSVVSTITSNGRYGYIDFANSAGAGFAKKGTALLYEAGLMIGYNTTRVSDCVRGGQNGIGTLSFKPLNNSHFIPSTFAYQQIISKYNDSAPVNSTPLGVEIQQTSYTINTSPLKNTVFLEYKIINKGTIDFDSLYIGNFIDWDIQNYFTNKADFDPDTRMGYVYDKSAGNLYGGLSLLTDQDINYYAMDNANVGGNNIDPNGTFNKAQRFQSISSGIARTQAGGINGNDVSMTMAGRVNHLKQGDTTIVAFALLAGNSLSELKTTAAAARTKFIELNTGPVPETETYLLCSGNVAATIHIQPSKGTTFRFYHEAPTPASMPFHTGSSYTLTNVSEADTVYITNTDSLYESGFARYVIKVIKSPSAAFAATPAPSGLPGTYLNQSIHYTSIEWNFGDGTTLTNIEAPTHTYSLSGNYDLRLIAKDGEVCADTIIKTIAITDIPTGIHPEMLAQNMYIYPVPVKETLHADLNLSGDTSADVTINNAMGQVVCMIKNVTLKPTDNTFDSSALSSGLYFLIIKTSTQQFSMRFIKE